MKNLQVRAFTLIELLIVVAIIAILAAIAVPNFLEAQTRSKVSRAKADMAVITTAMESYRVDYQAYPPINTEVSTGGRVDYIESRHAFLTTPISYLTTIYQDPFGDNVERSFTYSIDGELRYCTYDLLTFNDPEALETVIYKIDLVMLSGYPEQITWILASQGPDRNVGLSTNIGLAYDPTNGTVSEGDIIRTGP